MDFAFNFIVSHHIKTSPVKGAKFPLIDKDIIFVVILFD